MLLILTYSSVLLAIALISAKVVPFLTSILNVVSSTLVAILPSKYTLSNPKLLTCLWIVSVQVLTVPSRAVTVIVLTTSPVSGNIIVSSNCPTLTSPPIVTVAKIFDNTILTFAVFSEAFTVVS